MNPPPTLSATSAGNKQPNNMPSWRVWLRWLLANMSGATIGCMASALLACSTLGIGLFPAGALVGYFLAWSQQTVLRRYGIAENWQSGPFNFLTASIIGGLLGFLAYGLVLLGPSLLVEGLYSNIVLLILFALLAGAVGGAIIGQLQSMILKRYVKDVSLWTLAYAAGGALGSVVGLLIYNSLAVSGGDSTFLLISSAVLVVTSAVLGLIVTAAVTGIALVRIFERPGWEM